VRDAGFKEQIAMRRSGEGHLGFSAREYIAKQGELQFLPIQRVYINVVLPASHPFAKRKHVRLSDLAKERWVDLAEKEAAGFRAYFIQQCRLSGFSPRIVKTADTLDGMFGHVSGGYGITATPDHVRPRSGLPLALVRTDCPPIEFGAVWRGPAPSPLLQQFIEVLRRHIAALSKRAAVPAPGDSGAA
jgi:DNA-binding transcriptional LysR family regulator